MAEDCIGFEFFTNGNLSIADLHALEAASEHLQNKIAHFNAFGHLERATEAVQTAMVRHARGDQTPDPDDNPGYEDNVPPDLIGADDFLL